MSEYVVTDTELTAVADAIRTKGGTSASLEWYQGFVDAIGDISGGGSGSTLIMDQGQVSTTSSYATAEFDNSVVFSDYNALKFDLYRGGVKVASAVLGNGDYSYYTNNDFYIIGGGYTYSMRLNTSNKTIQCIHYSGSFVNLYIDVYGTNI